MAVDDTDPDVPIPDQGHGLAPWLAALCDGRYLKIVGPSRHRPDAFAVIQLTTGHDLDLWIVERHPLGAAALRGRGALDPWRYHGVRGPEVLRGEEVGRSSCATSAASRKRWSHPRIAGWDLAVNDHPTTWPA
jgi:hypothetical protein